MHSPVSGASAKHSPTNACQFKSKIGVTGGGGGKGGEGGGLGGGSGLGGGGLGATQSERIVLHVAGSTCTDKVVHVYLALNAVALSKIHEKSVTFEVFQSPM